MEMEMKMKMKMKMKRASCAYLVVDVGGFCGWARMAERVNRWDVGRAGGRGNGKARAGGAVRVARGGLKEGTTGRSAAHW